jgi:DNA-binding transcriptional MerR regulator
MKNLISTEETKYLESKKYQEDYPALNKTLTEPRFLISELGVTARDATYWDKQGILPDMKGLGARRKYDLVQSVWIKLIQQLREFGVSISVIKSLKDKLLQSTISLSDILKSPEGLEVFRTIAKTEGVEENFEELLKSGEFNKNAEGMEIDLFSNLVKTVVVFRKPISLLVSAEGDFTPYSLEIHSAIVKTDEKINEFFNSPHFNLSISSAYSQLVKDWATKPFFGNVSLLSNKELEALEAIREVGVKAVTMKYSGGELDLMEVVKNEKVDKESRFLDVISKHGFHNITVKSRNGNIVHFENKQMRKFKSTK